MKRLLIAAVALAAVWAGFGAAHAFDPLHGTKPVPKLNYDSLYAAAVPLDKSPDGQLLLHALLEKYGGRKKLEELKSFTMTLRMKAFLNQDSLDVAKVFQTGRQYKISRRNSGIHEVRILDRDSAWYAGIDTVILLDAGRYKAELFSYLTLAMPLALKTERLDGIRYGVRQGEPLAYIYLEKTDTLLMAIGIDPHEYLIKSSEGLIRQRENDFVFINLFSDHRQQDGYWFPFALTNISMGLEVARSVVTGIKVNVGFEETEFQPERLVDPQSLH